MKALKDKDTGCSTARALFAAAMAWTALLGGRVDGAAVFPKIDGPAEPYVIREDFQNTVKTPRHFFPPVHPEASRDLMNWMKGRNWRPRVPHEIDRWWRALDEIDRWIMDGRRTPGEAIEMGMKADEFQFGRSRAQFYYEEQETVQPPSGLRIEGTPPPASSP
ncbi:MAG: hypothetical protein ABR915_23060 [Thermoguttaceae bacterium]|jgi:hypothetical protein